MSASPDHPATPNSELRSGAGILIGCVLAMAIGVIALPGPAVGIFMTGMQRDLGWSRTEISLALSIGMGMLMLMSPVVGWLCDRYREQHVLAFGLAAMAVSFLLFSRISGNSSNFVLGYAVMMAVASGASTIPLARIISANFDKRRGIALGLAMIGTGLSGFILPLVLVPYVAHAGWRAGFVALASIVALGMPIVVLMLRGARHDVVKSSPAELQTGIEFGQASRSREFVLMACCFPLVTLAATGLQVHFIALMTDAGLSAIRAGAIASVSGVTLIIVRLITGLLIDRYFAPFVAAAMMVAASLCMGVFALLGAPAAVLGAICYGLAVGAELDIIGYLSARYFGMRAYGRIYGCLYATILIGSMISPILFSLSFDRFTSYTPALATATLMLALSGALLVALPRFPENDQETAS